VELTIRYTTPDIRCKHRHENTVTHAFVYLHLLTGDRNDWYSWDVWRSRRTVEAVRPSSGISDSTYPRRKQAHILYTKVTFCQLPTTCFYWQPCTCNRL